MARRKIGTLEKLTALLYVSSAIWIVSLANLQLGGPWMRFGIFPRTVDGLLGIALWPFLHGSQLHLAQNLAPLLVLGGVICVRSDKRFLQASLFITLAGGLGVWLLGRPALHLGASGLVFGYFGYIVARGYYDRSSASLLIALVISIIYGGLIWGVLPTDPYVSWEGHLFGLLAGIGYARWRGREGRRR